MSLQPGSSLDFTALKAAYAGGLSPVAVVRAVLARIAAAGEDHVWISRRSVADLLAEAEALAARGPEGLPLYGIPFAAKDNLDYDGLPTTAACPDFAHQPAETAPVIAQLIAAGAILIGKTNLDQFATGLVGARSPYGTARNSFNPAMAPGGSSSGSAVAVGAGLVSFALGTDTAGSGRVPAGFNNLVGLKPTRGLFSSRGMVPAARSLDCISIFALTVADAASVAEVAGGFDGADPYSRHAPDGFTFRQGSPAAFRFAVPRPDQRNFCGDLEAAGLFEAAIARAEALGGEAVEVDFAPYYEAALLLYGPLVAERTVELEERLRDKPETLHPITRAIIGAGLTKSAVEILRAQQRLQALAQQTEPLWASVDFMMVPTSPTAFSLEQIAAEPVARNSDLGTYTNFVNLLDMAAIAVPSAIYAKGPLQGFPAGVTLIGPAWSDGRLAAFGQRLQQAAGLPMGASGVALPPAPAVPAGRIATHPQVEIMVFGAHLSGQPLNRDLLSRGAVLRGVSKTAPVYRLYALPPTGGLPPRPGAVRVASGGVAVEGEIWAMPSAHLASFLATIASPLGLGMVQLESGPVLGFICEGVGPDAVEISQFGGWRAYLKAQAPAQPNPNPHPAAG